MRLELLIPLPIWSNHHCKSCCHCEHFTRGVKTTRTARIFTSYFHVGQHQLNKTRADKRPSVIQTKGLTGPPAWRHFSRLKVQSIRFISMHMRLWRTQCGMHTFWIKRVRKETYLVYFVTLCVCVCVCTLALSCYSSGAGYYQDDPLVEHIK